MTVRRLLTTATALSMLLLASIGIVSAASMSTASAADGFDKAKFNARTDAYMREHPVDPLGLKKFWDSMGVELLSVTYPDYGVRAATPAEADRLLRQRSSGRSLAALPSDTFTVSGSIGYITRTGEYVVQGNWNFKNSFVGGDPTPTDMAGLSVRSNCYNVRGTYWSIYDYAGNGHNGLGYLYDAQPDGDTALAIEDRVSGFVLYSDNGNLRYFMRASGCYTRDFQASFSFEHNQESGVVTSVSINLGIFNVSYSTTPLKLKKSTGIFS